MDIENIQYWYILKRTSAQFCEDISQNGALKFLRVYSCRYLENFICRFITEIFNTLQPLYNTVRYNTILDITQFKDGSQKIIDYIKNEHKWSFFNIIYTFLFGYNTVV